MNQQLLLDSSSQDNNNSNVTAEPMNEKVPHQTQQEEQTSWWNSTKKHADLHFQLMRNHFTAFYATNFGMSVGTAVFNTLLPIALRQAGETDATIGWIVALNGVGRLVAEIPISMISLKIGPWLTSLISMISLTLLFLVPTYFLTKWSWIVGMGAGGVAIAGFATPRHELLQAGFKKGERSRVSSHMGMIGRTSFLIAPASCGAIYQHIGPRFAFLFGLVFLLITIAALFSPELIELDETLRKKHEEEMEKKRRIEELKKQKELVGNDGLFGGDDDDTRSMDTNYNNNNNNPAEAQREALMETESNSSFMSTSSSSNSLAALGGANPSQFPLPAAAMYMQQQHQNQNQTVNEKRSVDEQHHSSPWVAFKEHWKTVVSVGFLVLSIMSIRQARRLTITLRSLDLKFDPRDVGFILAGSFVVDTVLFWISSLVVNKFGYVWAIAPLCLCYSVAFFVESIEPADGSAFTLFAALPIFGIGDSFGAGIVLSLISEMCPRALVGVTRLWLDAGVLVGPVVTGGIAHAVSLSVCCMVLGGWSLGACLFSIFLLRGGIGKQAEKH